MDDAIQRLDALMDFPAPFVFRVVARSAEGLQARCTAIVEAVLQRPAEHVDVATSGQGRWTSVRVHATVRSAEEVVETYAALRAVEGLKLLL